MQILHTDLSTFPYRISWENLIKDQRISPLGDHNYSLFSWPFLLDRYWHCWKKTDLHRFGYLWVKNLFERVRAFKIELDKQNKRTEQTNYSLILIGSKDACFWLKGVEASDRRRRIRVTWSSRQAGLFFSHCQMLKHLNKRAVYNALDLISK